MTFEPLSDRFVHDLEHSLDLPIPASAFPATSAPSASSPVSSPAGLFLSDVPGKPLNRLWPGRIPFGHLTLLDATPGCDLSLLALTLAACVSSGSPLPDGTPTLPGNVILFAPMTLPPIPSNRAWKPPVATPPTSCSSVRLSRMLRVQPLAPAPSRSPTIWITWPTPSATWTRAW